MENGLLLRLTPSAIGTKLTIALYVILALLFANLTSANAQIRSAKSGNWHEAATWANNIVPGASDAVLISDGHHITITGQAQCATIDIHPPHNSGSIDRSELILAQQAILSVTRLTLNPKNDRRYTSFVNNGGTLNATLLQVGNGCEVHNVTGSLVITGDVENNGDIINTTALLEVGGRYLTGNKGIFIQGSGTVRYSGNGTATQTIAGIPYHHLQLTGNSPKLPATDLTIAGNLTIANNSTLRQGGFTHTIAGNLINSGSLSSETTVPSGITVSGNFVNNGSTAAGAAIYTIAGDFENNGSYQAGTSTVILQGTTLQQLKGTTTFYNLQHQGTAEANLLNDITISNTISISNSHFNTGSSTITLQPNATLTTTETDAAHIIGTIKTSRLLTASAQESFGNIGLTLTRNNIDPGMITVERLIGVATEISGTESITRQYNITRDGTNDITALSMTMELAFLPTELQAKPLSEFKLYNKDKNNEAMPLQSTVLNQTTMRHINSNRFGTFTLAPPIMPLPVELVWFKASKQNQTVNLQWKTASEHNNKGFEVQVATDGKTYQTIAFVASKSGNSSLPQLYTFTDNNPALNFTLHYRLKQVDEDGSYSLSKAVAVAAFNGQFTLQATPNPFTDNIRLASGHVPAHVIITDMNGKVMLQQHLQPTQRTPDGYYQVNTAELKSSMYVLTVTTPDKTYHTKLLKR